MALTPPPRPRIGAGDIAEIELPGIGPRFDLRDVDGGPSLFPTAEPSGADR